MITTVSLLVSLFIFKLFNIVLRDETKTQKSVLLQKLNMNDYYSIYWFHKNQIMRLKIFGTLLFESKVLSAPNIIILIDIG